MGQYNRTLPCHILVNNCTEDVSCVLKENIPFVDIIYVCICIYVKEKGLSVCGAFQVSVVKWDPNISNKHTIVILHNLAHETNIFVSVSLHVVYFMK